MNAIDRYFLMSMGELASLTEAQILEIVECMDSLDYDITDQQYYEPYGRGCCHDTF